MAAVSWEYIRARLNRGSAIVMIIRMIAITISNSIRENPRRLLEFCGRALVLVDRLEEKLPQVERGVEHLVAHPNLRQVSRECGFDDVPDHATDARRGGVSEQSHGGSRKIFCVNMLAVQFLGEVQQHLHEVFVGLQQVSARTVIPLLVTLQLQLHAKQLDLQLLGLLDLLVDTTLMFLSATLLLVDMMLQLLRTPLFMIALQP